MSKINILSSTIYNRIAAGEVVERPFSVAKETVENALDAGAKNITVEIEDGGKSLIRVTDDGSGIEKSELKKALMPHATSKISKLSDLDNILSLGFRGEALASIASVARVTIVSKSPSCDTAAKIHAEGGVIGNAEVCGFSNGTEVTVQNLFFNTPAREKFLKTAKSEESEIGAVMARFILGNPDVSFKYVADGKVISQSFGDGLAAAMTCVYGAVLNDCYYIDTEKNGIKLTGYIGKQNFTKPNRTYQTFFLNGRYINNQTVSAAIHNAYGAYMMKRQYPFYVLSCEMPHEAVDVNVHPNKTDVRFANNQVVYGTIYSVVSKVLDGISEALNIVTESPADKGKNNQIKDKDLNINYATHNRLGNVRKTAGSITLSDAAKGSVVNSAKSVGVEMIQEVGKANGENSNDIFAENKAYIERLEKLRAERVSEPEGFIKTKPEQQTLSVKRNLRYVGQVLNTYLVLDDGEFVYFADQHAAHERLLFDKFKDELSKNEIITQPLLLPYILDVNGTEAEFITVKERTLNEMGIEIAPFGVNSFKISALPAVIADMNIGNFFSDLLTDLNSLKAITLDDMLKDKIAQKACKAAIKSGDTLKEQEISTLVAALERDIGLRCPHGRPVAAKISRTEIDKWFKRIL